MMRQKLGHLGHLAGAALIVGSCFIFGAGFAVVVVLLAKAGVL